MNTVEQLTKGLHFGFIDEETTAMGQYAPKLVVNDYKNGVKVLSTIETELKDCTEFYFSVAFITNSGVQSIINMLDVLQAKGVKGKIITSQYQNFTQPEAFRRLLKYDNIELRIVMEGNFHAKGYIFKKSDLTYSFLIGSSNLTQNALSENKEWNLRLSASEDGAAMRSLVKEFRNTFAEAEIVDEDWLSRYERIYHYVNAYRNSVVKRNEPAKVIRVNQILPNKMQKEALEQLAQLRAEGKDKGLLISATGTRYILWTGRKVA